MVFVPQTPVRSCLRHDEGVGSCESSFTENVERLHLPHTCINWILRCSRPAAAGLGNRERSVVILMDKMHIREDIVVSGTYNSTEHANLSIQTFQVGLLILGPFEEI